MACRAELIGHPAAPANMLHAASSIYQTLHLTNDGVSWLRKNKTGRSLYTGLRKLEAHPTLQVH